MIRNSLCDCTLKSKLFLFQKLTTRLNYSSCPFFFTQSMLFKTLRAQPSVSSRLPLNSLKMFGSLALITPVAIAITIFQEIAVPAKREHFFHHPLNLVFLFFELAQWLIIFLLLATLFPSIDCCSLE